MFLFNWNPEKLYIRVNLLSPEHDKTRSELTKRPSKRSSTDQVSAYDKVVQRLQLLILQLNNQLSRKPTPEPAEKCQAKPTNKH